MKVQAMKVVRVTKKRRKVVELMGLNGTKIQKLT